jgi:hypothetical protein
MLILGFLIKPFKGRILLLETTVKRVGDDFSTEGCDEIVFRLFVKDLLFQ